MLSRSPSTSRRPARSRPRRHWPHRKRRRTLSEAVLLLLLLTATIHAPGRWGWLRLLLPSATTATNGGCDLFFFLTEAGAGTWEGKAGYTGCAGYPHMTRLPKWAGMQEYVGSRRCPTQRVSQVAHAVCILTHTHAGQHHRQHTAESEAESRGDSPHAGLQVFLY